MSLVGTTESIISEGKLAAPARGALLKSIARNWTCFAAACYTKKSLYVRL
jgi:hypothetical protein